MDNATLASGQAVKEEESGTSGEGHAEGLTVFVFSVVLFLAVVIGISFFRRKCVTKSTKEQSEKGKDSELGLELPSATPTSTATSCGESQVPIKTRESRFLDPNETWFKARSLFPGLLSDITFSVIEQKYIKRRFNPYIDANGAIQAELLEKLSFKIFCLSKEENWDAEDFERECRRALYGYRDGHGSRSPEVSPHQESQGKLPINPNWQDPCSSFYPTLD